MPNRFYDLNPVDRITTAAVGEPGKRVFYIQGRKRRRLLTVICEKEHVATLALAIEQFLLSLAGNDPEEVVEPDPAIEGGMDLEYPLDPAFRAGEVGLGYDEAHQRLVLIAYEALDEGEGSVPSRAGSDLAQPRGGAALRPSVARFWATPAQMRAFALHGQRVVASGRPRCAMCGEPIDLEGHFCPRKNGDRRTG